jgi:hypothetical protein
MVRVLFAGVFLHGILWAQLTTGIVEGVLRSLDGRPLSGAVLTVNGDPGFHAEVRSRDDGGFVLVLPYGRYRLSADILVFVAPLQITRLDLVMDPHGVFHAVEPRVDRMSAGLWSDTSRGLRFPEGFSVQSALATREPFSITTPLDFSGLSDSGLGLESQHASSWTDTQFKLMGMDTTDSYQPGRPAILADVQALDQEVVRGAFAQTASSGFGTEVSMFLAQPEGSWHGAFITSNTGSALASSNLPPPATRGILQQAQYFRRFTRDSLQIGGPVTRWLDLFATATGGWSAQTVPLEPPGTDQRSRLLFGNLRGRVRAGPRDQFDALFSGSRIDLSDWGNAAGLEPLIGRRMSPEFVLPQGFPNQPEVDHLDFLQAGWTHELESGVTQLRYGYSIAHLDTDVPTGVAGLPSKIDLLDGVVTGAPPIGNFAIRSRHEVEGSWQLGTLDTAGTRHHISVGVGWKTASPVNRFNVPSGTDLITAAGAPAFVVGYNSPSVSRAFVRSLTAYAADHADMSHGLSLDLGVLADFSRGSVPNQSDRIAWNSVSPRGGFAWQIPFLPRLVLRATYFRIDSPLAGRYLDFGNPNSLGGSMYPWIDRNGDGQFEAGEEGPLLLRFGGPYSSIAPSLRRPYADEVEVGADWGFHRGFLGLHLFRRDDKQRIAAVDVGVSFEDFTPVSIIDPLNQHPLTVYQQNPATFGQDRYLLTNPGGLRAMNTGLLLEARKDWGRFTLHASFVAEKSYGPTNPGNSVLENDPGVVGALLLDPNTAIYAEGRNFTDPSYVAKLQATYRFAPSWGRFEVATVGDYKDGLVFGRELLVTGLAQGPIVVPATRKEVLTFRGNAPGYRTTYVMNWNLRLARQFKLPYGRMSLAADVLNVTNTSHHLQESDLTSPSFSERLPVQILPPRFVRIEFRYEF